MNKKICKILILLCLTILVMPSSLAVDTLIKKQENIKSQNEVYVDSDIHLSKRFIPLVKKGLSELKNQDYKMFLQELIEKLNQKNTVNSQDIMEIIETNNLNISGVYSGSLGSDDLYFGGDISGYGPGNSWIFPGVRRMIRNALLFALLLGGGGGTFALSWGSILYWGADNADAPPGAEINVVINGRSPLDHRHEGAAIGFFGYVARSLHIQGQYIWESFNFEGKCLFVIV